MPVTVLIVECFTPAALRELSGKDLRHFEAQARASKTGIHTNAKSTLRASIRRFEFAVSDKAEFESFVTALTASKYVHVEFLEEVTHCGCSGEACRECGYSSERVNKCTCSFTTCHWCSSAENAMS